MHTNGGRPVHVNPGILAPMAGNRYSTAFDLGREIRTLFLWYWIDRMTSLVALHPQAALAIAFAAAVIEAVAVLGVLLPGTPILMAVAGVAAAAGQSMLPFLVVAIAGAVLGDFVSFSLGRRYATTMRGLWPFSRRPNLLRSSDDFFARYGSFSVALCRFVPVLRSTVPLVAGMARMRASKFVLANVLSAFVWAPAHIYPAQLAGASLEYFATGDVTTALACAAAVLAACAAAYGAHRLFARRIRK